MKKGSLEILKINAFFGKASETKDQHLNIYSHFLYSSYEIIFTEKNFFFLHRRKRKRLSFSVLTVKRSLKLYDISIVEQFVLI